MKFTLRQLEVFVAVGRYENVSKAAVALALSQSATSTALAQLERQFDSQLFDRAGKTLRLNETGRQLMPRAIEMLDRAREIEELLEDHSGFGPLRIGATLTIGNYLATLVAANYLQQHPDCHVHLEVHNTATIVEQVAHFEFDMGLIEGGCQHPALTVEPWVEDELTVFCAPDHPLARAGEVPLERVLAEPWIVREKGSGTRETFNHALRHHQNRLNIRLELEHTEAIKRAVESGLGIGCISRLALKEAFRRGSLSPVHTPELDLRRQFNFIWHRQKFQTAGMREFLAQCRAMTEGVRRSDEINLPYIA